MNSAVVRALLARGMFAGVAAGAVAFALAYLVGEPQVDAAIAFEDAHAKGSDMELVSRSLQSTAGLATAVLVFGAAVGGIAALAFCFALGRIGRFSPRATAALLAGAAFATLCLVPSLKYPAGPPSVGSADTIGKRTALYFLMIALTVLLALAATLLGRALAPRWGNWNATLGAMAVFIAAMAAAAVFLPAVDEVPEDFPATVLWQFRLASIAVQALLWACFGVVFGWLADRVLLARAAGPAEAAAAPGMPTTV